MRAAATLWQDIIRDDWTVNIEYYWDLIVVPDPTTGQPTYPLGGTVFPIGSQGGKPTGATIRFQNDCQYWYLDSTPSENSEFELSQTLFPNRDIFPDGFSGSPPAQLEVVLLLSDFD